MAEISIIIPCYNAEQYIDRCLASIVTQDIGLAYLYIICIDDASTDSTWQHLLQWEQQYPDSFSCIHCELNRRQGAARNLGMQYVETPYVSFMDADDWIDFDYYSSMYYLAVKMNCKLSVANVNEILQSNQSPKPIEAQEKRVVLLTLILFPPESFSFVKSLWT